MTLRFGHALLIASAAGWLAGCGAVPWPTKAIDRSAGETPVPVALPDPLAAVRADFAMAERAHALALEDQGRLADAAIAWDVLGVVAPANADDAAHRARLQKQIDAAVGERLRRSDVARRRGDVDQAERQALGALALQPRNPDAADALRTLERERNRQQLLRAHPHGSVANGTSNTSGTGRPGDDALVIEPPSPPSSAGRPTVRKTAKPAPVLPPPVPGDTDLR